MAMNGAGLEAYLAAAALRLESLFPVVLTVDGEDYVGTGGGTLEREDITEGGFLDEGKRLVRVRKAVLASAPSIGDLVAVDGLEVRVVSVSDKEWDVCWPFELEPVR